MAALPLVVPRHSAMGYVRYRPDTQIVRLTWDRGFEDYTGITVLFYLDRTGKFIWQAFCPRDVVGFTPQTCYSPSYYIPVSSFVNAVTRISQAKLEQTKRAILAAKAEYNQRDQNRLYYEKLRASQGDPELDKTVGYWSRLAGESSNRIRLVLEPRERKQGELCQNKLKELQEYISQKLRSMNQGFPEESKKITDGFVLSDLLMRTFSEANNQRLYKCWAKSDGHRVYLGYHPDGNKKIDWHHGIDASAYGRSQQEALNKLKLSVDPECPQCGNFAATCSSELAYPVAPNGVGTLRGSRVWQAWHPDNPPKSKHPQIRGWFREPMPEYRPRYGMNSWYW